MLQHVAYLVGFSFLLALGQLCFKSAANHLNQNNDLPIIEALISNFWLWGAFALYGMSSLLWVFILRVVPLNLAYPFVAIGFILVPLGGWYFFSEHVNSWYILGVGFIILGLLIITLKAQI
ncbi:DMT family transporter [Curvivirga aplysinae]|uniref:hypothetical protein n=1 Tax=Curvivirga aplysinae TaxID=2529852 RepID=UPI0012BC17BB|nr:hypothetical protein [Curvivirga aplysinae]MTI09387.1 hypothetical protein [Curvivirga aplysinae]